MTSDVCELGNGGDGDRTEFYEQFIYCGVCEEVAIKLEDIFRAGKLSENDLDQRALDALKQFNTDDAINVLTKFQNANTEFVANKSAYLCSIMKIYRQKRKMFTCGALSSPATSLTSIHMRIPTESKESIKSMLERTGYRLDVTPGQRMYGGPPPNWRGAPPGKGCEVFCRKIPYYVFEDVLVPLFESIDSIYSLRLMMDALTGLNRGFAFVTYSTPAAAARAVKVLNQYEIKQGKCLKLNVSIPNTRLFVGNLPKIKSQAEISEKFHSLVVDLTEVIVYASVENGNKNRGFCFLEFDSHKAASLAKQKLSIGRFKVWDCDIIVDWADVEEEEPDSEIMAKVKILYLRNLREEITEHLLQLKFEPFGKVEHVKRIKHFAFVHFSQREEAENALSELNGKTLSGTKLQITFAKPPVDAKKREAIIRARERRQSRIFQERFSFFKRYRNISKDRFGLATATATAGKEKKFWTPSLQMRFNANLPQDMLHNIVTPHP